MYLLHIMICMLMIVEDEGKKKQKKEGRKERVFILAGKRGNQTEIHTFQLFTICLTYSANQESNWVYVMKKVNK